MSKWVWIVALGGMLLLGGERELSAQVSPDATKKESALESGRKRPHKPVAFQEGPSIQPPERLLEWLNITSKRNTEHLRHLRLPVVFFFEGESRLHYTAAVIGGPDMASPGGRIHLRVIDTRLGISLMTHLRTNCPKEKRRCAVWLEGYWGEDLVMPEFEEKKEGDKRWPFTLRWVGSFFVDADPVDKDLRVGVVKPTK